MKWLLILATLANLSSGCREIKPEEPLYGYGTEPEQTTGADAILSQQTPHNITSAVGMTLAAFGAASREWQTIDQMLQAEDWQEVACDALPADATSPGVGAHVLDANGWITELPLKGRCVGTRLFQGARGSYPSGRYLVRFSGGASLSVAGDANAVASLGTELAAFDVVTPSEAGVLLKISSLTAGNPIRNIQVIAPGGVCGKSLTELLPFSYCRTDRGGSGSCGTGLTCFDFSKITINTSESNDLSQFNDLVTGRSKVFFHPLFLQSLRPYKSLGFRHWLMPAGRFARDLGTLNSNVAHFAEDRGAPPEIAATLANLLEADPWISIPADASEELVTTTASLFKARLKSNLTVHLDYGGEFWIEGSVARDYMTLAAELLHLPSYEVFYVQRLSTFAAAWKSAFGTEAARIQVAGFVNATDTEMPARLQTVVTPPPFTYFATSAHFLAPAVEGIDEESTADFFEAITGGPGVAAEESSFGQTQARLQALASAVSTLGLPLVAYGSGPAFTPALTWDDARDPLRNDERMGALISLNLQTWKDLGGRLIFFDKSADDTRTESGWGALRTQQDSRSRLANALREFIEANPCWWEGCQTTTTP
ncbi:hypothetical protein [Oligoflexus tunisiensis]|uniref:hypothetical protein n=1 Tax=Oligoflexus tunisiensis TaxID=708132 RepID=UPI00114D076A|nr:hypothetical protein [Oligoflexus tunisiensis]